MSTRIKADFVSCLEIFVTILSIQYSVFIYLPFDLHCVTFCILFILTLWVPVSYQQPTSPYITHTQYDIWWWENENWSNKANYWRLKVKFSQIRSMKSMGSGWENLKIQLALKGLISKNRVSILSVLDSLQQWLIIIWNITQCPRWIRQTAALGSLPRSHRQVRRFFEVPR